MGLMSWISVDTYSKTIGMCMQLEVLLPVRRKSTKDMPVLYLLHGAGDNNLGWMRNTSIERYVRDLDVDMAVVMPTTYLGWYTDMAYGSKFWTFFTEELPQICHSMFNGLSWKKEDTFVAGLSMGGYGALKLGLGTDQYAYAASLSGGVDVLRRRLQTAENLPFWQGVFGDLKEAQNTDNDLFWLSEQKMKNCQDKSTLPRLFMCCGDQDFLIEDNRRMKDHLQNCGYDLTYMETPGTHEWGYWDRHIQDVLRWLPLK